MPGKASVKKMPNLLQLRTMNFMPQFISRLNAQIIFFLCFISFAPTAFADFSDADKSEIKSIIKEFITENPAIIRDVLTQLAITEKAERKRKALALLKNDDGDPVIGPSDAAITIYEFSDYNCGYCKRIFNDLQAVLAEQPDVRLVVKEFPILAETSVLAAKAAIAAHRQGKFRQFHISMMTWRGKIDGDAIDAAVQKAGLDKNRLRKDMEDELTAAILSKTRAAAAHLR